MDIKQFYRCKLEDHFSQDELFAARIQASQVAIDCHREAGQTGYFASHVTPSEIKKYRTGRLIEICQIQRGELDHTFTIRQRLEGILLGSCSPLLA